ncbi:MAG: NADH-quinone oxidoreductase subunit L [Candidatus Thermoplasmatota archaeon]|jgi:NADH-quinone oxidoreductase subunit L|nr:NADH-quinone oxidoreductase subunit L [Candidatus Thermoplasmatota archaeon]
MFLDNELLVWLCLIFPFVGTALVPVLARVGQSIRTAFAVIIGFCTAGSVLLLLPDIWIGRTEGLSYTVSWAPSIGLVFSVYIDPLSVMMAAVAGGIGSLVLLYSVKYMAGQEGLTRYYALVLLFIGSMIGLVFVDNLLVLYFFWEAVGLCSYALIGFYTKDPKAAKAGIKALVITRVGDIAFLIGIFVLASGAMTALGVDFWQALSIHSLIQNVASIPLQTLSIAGFCFLLGAMGKSAQVPLHVWLPDAMEAPTTISALIHAATMVNAGVYLLARSLPLFMDVPYWMTALLVVGGITAFLAATMALVEHDLKRVLAYSTVSQLGYMVFALGLVSGFTAATFHLMSHAIFKALLFLGAGAVIHSVGTRNMYQMGGLKKDMKITYLAMLIGGLSLAGLIPLSGFWSKDMILATAWETGNYLPLLLMVLTAILTAAYTLRMINLVFWGESRRDKTAHEAAWQMSVPLILLAFGTLVAWLGVGFLSRAYHSFDLSEHALTLSAFLLETFETPVVWISIAAFLIGLALFKIRKQYAANSAGEKTIIVARNGYGFDAFYGNIIRCLRWFSAQFRKTHTGDLNYNIVGIALGFLLLIFFLFLLGGGW